MRDEKREAYITMVGCQTFRDKNVITELERKRPVGLGDLDSSSSLSAPFRQCSVLVLIFKATFTGGQRGETWSLETKAIPFRKSRMME